VVSVVAGDAWTVRSDGIGPVKIGMTIAELNATGIRFETEKGKITLFYAGTKTAIQYVEGCG
jgi:hypothetical protein